MLSRTAGALILAGALSTTAATAQASAQGEGVARGTAAAAQDEVVARGRPLSEWIADLKAAAPLTRNAAAYEIAGLGPAAAAAVPALIEALDDESPAVRFPVTVALGEIGPAAAAAVPRLKQVFEEDFNDEIAAGARRAIKRIRPEALPAE